MRITAILTSVLGVFFAVGCQEQRRQPVYQPPEQQPQVQQREPEGRFQADTPATQREMYFTQGQQQIAQMENAIRNLEQVVVQMEALDAYEPYAQALAEKLQVAYNRLSAVQHASDERLDDAVGHLISAIDELLDTYNEAAAHIQQYLSAP